MTCPKTHACRFKSRLARAVGLVALLSMGSPSLAFSQGHLHEGDDREEGPPPKGYAPDPKPLVSKKQWKLGFVYREGQIELRSVEPVELEKPVATARRMGRFAVELLIGQELIDRVRFDFPLLAGEEALGKRRPHDAPPSFEKRLTTRTTVMVPHSERATRARLVDRATGRILELPWPLQEPSAEESKPKE